MQPEFTDGTGQETVQWRGLAAAIASISVVGIAIGLGMPLLSFVLEARGFSAGMIGLNTAVAGLASLAAAPFATPLAVRFGMIPVVLAMLAIGGVSFVSFHFFDSFASWFVLRAALHFAITVLFILSESWINHCAPPARRGFVLGVYATVLSLGFAAGPWIFAQLGSEGFLPFGFTLALITLAALPVLLATRDAPDLAGDDGIAAGSDFWRYIILVPTATFAVLVFGAVETGGFALFPVYGLRVGYDEASAALLLTMVGLGNVVLQIPLGIISDRVRDRRTILLACAVTGLAGMGVLPMISHDWHMTAAMLFVWGGVVAGLYTVSLAHLGARLRGRQLVQANAAFVFCYALGMLAGPAAIGVGMEVSGPNGFAHVLAAFFAVYIALILSRQIMRPRKTA
ncbi:MAG: MFS transporter [Zhengella sp.]|uniref:MFS transporter n=1 Tax=Zhengella sp. TaxID=2282762 RepID=UPI001D846A4E|nr:MFS transporter [Notoacmeibacter sp.]MCC0028071.1 MFS transporter [Brucellaceae bacterium]